MLVGHSTVEQRRFLQLAERARAARPKGATVYLEVAIGLVRALTADAGVGQAVLDGRRAVDLAEEGADELLTAALAAYARALYFAGDLDEALGGCTPRARAPRRRGSSTEPRDCPLDSRTRRL